MFANARVTQCCLALVLIFASGAAVAGSFNVAPIRLFFDAKAKSAVLRVSNKDQEKATLQLDVLEWTQDEQGVDQYAPTQDIVFFPKIVTLEKDEEKVVRVGYPAAGPETRERTYRLYLEELPVSKPGETMVKTVLRMAVPIFIAPLQPHRTSMVDKVDVRAGAAGITVKNTGNQHVFVSEVKATGLGAADAETFFGEVSGWYVLPGASRTFVVDLPKQACEASKSIKVTVKLKQQAELGAESEVNPAQCRDPAQGEQESVKPADPVPSPG